MFTTSERWRTTYPGAAIGILLMRGVANPKRHDALDKRKEELENRLRSRFSDSDRAAIKALPVIQAYNAYYKLFRKTYHVQLQLESIVFKGGSVPRVSALIETMFMAELENLLLTAGHDWEALAKPVGIDVAEGHERYVRLNGQEQQMKSGDMMIADGQGLISSILYGPDHRTRITSETKHVLFTVYAPPGIGEQTVREHLKGIRENVLLIAPEAEVGVLEVYGTERQE